MKKKFETLGILHETKRDLRLLTALQEQRITMYELVDQLVKDALARLQPRGHDA